MAMKQIIEWLAALFGNHKQEPGESDKVLVGISEDGINLIKRFEGCRLTAYRDPVGVLTIGRGDTENVHEGMRITQQEADTRLHTRLDSEFVPGVLDNITRSMRQHQ